MRISDWSSDVCSSDLIETFRKRYRDHFPGDLSRSRIYADVSKGMMPGGIESWLPLFFNDGTSMLTDYLPTDAVLVALEELERALDEDWQQIGERSEEHTSELQSLMRISYAVFCLKKKTKMIKQQIHERI